MNASVCVNAAFLVECFSASDCAVAYDLKYQPARVASIALLRSQLLTVVQLPSEKTSPSHLASSVGNLGWCLRLEVPIDHGTLKSDESDEPCILLHQVGHWKVLNLQPTKH